MTEAERSVRFEETRPRHALRRGAAGNLAGRFVSHRKHFEVRRRNQREAVLEDDIAFARLPEVDPAEIASHMSDPRVAEHMPLMTQKWDDDAVARFVDHKERCWARDGLGHWAFLSDGRYVGWGGFQKEGDEWDFGLVLRPDAFGLGRRVTRKALDFAVADARIPFVTFLLPPSRKRLGAFERLGARPVGEIDYDDATFLKFRLETGG